ncbi:major facilitator superfamily domain-containing protein [Coniella lustricola]|uniref:Major facilitator superfamily domain-containing protein n=1 Tax=Coniella lustricola TaxID=2025994 RepID=A0A2T2ZVX4_9PEZI|nr:major facilitator superfamily domain-containing protein [Coniella lustricola]
MGHGRRRNHQRRAQPRLAVHVRRRPGASHCRGGRGRAEHPPATTPTAAAAIQPPLVPPQPPATCRCASERHENVDVEAAAAHQQQPDSTEAPFSAFATRSKQLIVLGAASASVFAPLSMQVYLPSLTELVSDFGVSRSAVNLTVSVYMIFMAISPMLIGGLADVVGRRPAMLACFAIYMVSCVMIALCHTYKELMGFRILQSIGASPTIAIASAVVADIVTSAERGSYAALVALPVIFAPTLGPVIGGLLTQYLGWRSIFWFLLIAGAFTFVMIAVFFPETCRYIVGDASAKPPRRYRSVAQMVQKAQQARPEWTQSSADEKARLRGQHSVRRTTYLSLTAALRILLTRERFCLLFYVGLIFAGFQAIATELPTQFKAIYGYDSVMIGIMYLPLAGGAMISTAVFGKQMNRNFQKYAARAGINLEAGQEVDMNRVNVERARLEITVAPLLISTAGIVCWGWVLEKKTSIAAPCVLLFFMGVGLNGVMATTNALLMDISQSQAGAVMAASNLTRCALGAVASAAIQTMIDKMGLGWTYVVFGVVFFAFSPMMALHFYRGHHMRMQAKARADRARDKDAPLAPEAAMVQAAAVDAVVNATTAIPLVEIKSRDGKDEKQ